MQMCSSKQHMASDNKDGCLRDLLLGQEDNPPFQLTPQMSRPFAKPREDGQADTFVWSPSD